MTFKWKYSLGLILSLRLYKCLHFYFYFFLNLTFPRPNLAVELRMFLENSFLRQLNHNNGSGSVSPEPTFDDKVNTKRPEIIKFLNENMAVMRTLRRKMRFSLAQRKLRFYWTSWLDSTIWNYICEGGPKLMLNIFGGTDWLIQVRSWFECWPGAKIMVNKDIIAIEIWKRKCQ